jgi:hypothetical protein
MDNQKSSNMSILNTQVSWFKDYYNTEPGGTVSLIQWLQSKKLQQQVEAIRALPTKAQRDAAKSKLPAITPSGIFSARNSQSLIKHSDIICIDIDKTGNEAIENYSDLKKELCNLKQVAYCGASVSGTGFFLIIPLAYPDRHKEQFQALKNEFWKWGIVIDKSCGNIDRLRGASFDADAHYNHDALPYTGLPDADKKRYQQQTPAMIDGTVFEKAIYYTEKIHHNKFEQGNRHWYIYRIAEYLAANGVDQWAASEWIYNNVLCKDEINSNCISYPYQLNDNSTTQQKPARDPSPPPVPDGITRARNDGGVSGTTSTSAPDGPIIGPHGYPASWDEIPAKFQAVVTIGTNTPRAPQTVENETIEGVNECFTFDWFVSEAQKCFTRSMIKAPGDYYPAFITSYRATLRRAGINERELMEALIL